jgi:hypothetical protein
VIEMCSAGYAVEGMIREEGPMDEQGGTGRGEVDDERIRERAYEISMREDAGTPEENWQRAEAELRDAASAGSSGAPTSGDQPSEDLPGAASP